MPYKSDVKRMIVPIYNGHGGLFVMADQSQLEIRVLASIVEKYYGDPSLAQAYREGRDIHKFNASRVFAKPMEEISDAERRFAKTISFSLLYGSSEKSVAEDTGRTPDEVHSLFEQFFESFPGVRKYIKASHEFATKYGIVRTPMGRLKHIPGYDNQEDKGAYNRAMRQAQNGIIQSTGSDMSLLSIVYMDEYLRKHNMESKVVAFVHDSIAIDAHPGEFIECYDLLLFSMKELLEKMDWVTAPLGIDVEISTNYGDSASVKKLTKNDDGSRTYLLDGYDYVLDDIIKELAISYEISKDTIIKEEEFVNKAGPLIARKSINLSFDNKTFNEQTREVTISKK